MIAIVALFTAAARADALANQDQIDLDERIAKFQAEIQQMQARLNEQIAQAQLQRARSLEALNRTEREIAELNQKRQQATDKIKAIEEEVAKAKADLEKDLAPATRPAAGTAVDAFKLVEKERQALIDALGPNTRPATQPIDDLKQRLALAQADNEALRFVIARQKEEIQALTEQLELLIRKQANPPQIPEIKATGQIKAKKNINGIDYATVSLGGKDHLEKGLRLRIMDRDTLVGYLIIDLVETDQSVGHLEGPDISKIKPGMVVVQ